MYHTAKMKYNRKHGSYLSKISTLTEIQEQITNYE